jgi:hypothetical protein
MMPMKNVFSFVSDVPKKMPSKKYPLERAIWILFAVRGWVYLGNFSWRMKNQKIKVIIDPIEFTKGK